MITMESLIGQMTIGMQTEFPTTLNWQSASLLLSTMITTDNVTTLIPMMTKMECLMTMKSYSGLHASTETQQILGTTMTSEMEKDLQTHWMQEQVQMQSTTMTTTIHSSTLISTTLKKAKLDSLATMEANRVIGITITTACLMKMTKHQHTSRSIYLILCGLMHNPHPSSVGTSIG